MSTSDKSFKVRASSWGRLFDCAHSWEGSYILGIKKPTGPRALLGTAIHAGTAAFDIARMVGDVISPDDAIGVVSDTLLHPEYDVDWAIDDLSPGDAKEIGKILTSRYCVEISPQYTFRAVEMETKPLVIDCGSGVLVELTGTLDRSRLREGFHGLGITDLKSGGTAVEKGKAKTKGHAAQVGTYELLYQHTTEEPITEPAEIIGLKTKGKPEIATAEITGARQMMAGTEDSPGLIQYAATMFRSGMFPPNPQSMICNPKYCARWATCKFHN